jgi:hypothetical protein
MADIMGMIQQVMLTAMAVYKAVRSIPDLKWIIVMIKK